MDSAFGEDLMKLQQLHMDEIERTATIIWEETVKQENSPRDAYIYASCSGIVGSISVFLSSFVSKSVISLITEDQGQYKKAYFYLFPIALVCTSLTQVHFMQRGLKLGDTMAVYPCFMAFWIGFGAIGSTVLYQEADKITGTEWGLLITALLFMLIGLFFLWKHADSQ